MQKYYHLYGAETKNKRATRLQKEAWASPRRSHRTDMWMVKSCVWRTFEFSSPAVQARHLHHESSSSLQVGEQSAQVHLSIPKVQG